MPIYDYACSACGKRTEVIHGINEAGPKFCPVCGTEGSMKKAFSPPSILFKGSGWAKVDRRSSSGSSSTKPAGGAKSGEGGTSDGASGSSTPSSSGGDGASKAGSEPSAGTSRSSTETSSKGGASGGSD